MAQVLVPQKKDDTNSLLTMGGAIAGGIAGTLAAPGAGTAAGATLGASLGGAATGALTGSQVGGLAGGLLNPEKAGPQPLSSNAPSGMNSDTSPSAISRRLQQIDANPVQQLSAAQQALKYQPPDMQKQYQDTINQALILAQRDQRRGMA